MTVRQKKKLNNKGTFCMNDFIDLDYIRLGVFAIDSVSLDS